MWYNAFNPYSESIEFRVGCVRYKVEIQILHFELPAEIPCCPDKMIQLEEIQVAVVGNDVMTAAASCEISFLTLTIWAKHVQI